MKRSTSSSNLTFGRISSNYANALSGGAYSSLEPTLRALLPGTPAGTFGAQGQGVFEKYNYKNEAYSIFGQVDFEPVEGLTLTAGGNYTHDKKDVIANVRVDRCVLGPRSGAGRCSRRRAGDAGDQSGG